MTSKWRKVKLALGKKLCISVPGTVDSPSPGRLSGSCDTLISPPTTSHVFRLTKSLSRSFTKKICSICLATMKPGDGNAIFTAECSHSFHFHCIASNVRHGNQSCPVCRAKWNEIPFDVPIPGPSIRNKQTMINPLDNALMTMYRRMPISPRPMTNRHITPPSPQFIEPAVFNDDECLNHQCPTLTDTPIEADNRSFGEKKVKIETYPEVPAVPRLSTLDNFTVLIHLKAPTHMNLQTTRAPIDLVTVLDISGSMAGTKLALLKRAMGFVIQNLGPSDRLSVIAFSSRARRLFALRRMSETGKRQALQDVNSLAANGGTNIAEGLRKGAKVMEERREKNPVAGIILLSDGQDTYTVTNCRPTPTEPNHHALLHMSFCGNKSSESKIPVHAFGFGMDHDASLMHSISDVSGGTFSFIETESVIQDAFAQCIGGLLSVVVKDLQVLVECVHTNLFLNSIRAGSYPNRLTPDRRTGYLDVGDLYAEEERDFLISVSIPTEVTSLLKVRCVYSDPLTKKMVNVENEEVIIQRPEVVQQEMVVSIEVDRQTNRIQAAEAMARAKTLAEQGNLGSARNILENCRKSLSKSVSAIANDTFCVGLEMELKEMEERMGNRHAYEASGRAYMLSGLSSHSWQRATARGDSTHSSSRVSSYQTPSMTEMVNRSQASMLLASPSGTRRNLISPKPR